MRFSWARLALASVLAGLVVAPITNAYGQQASDVKVDVNIKDADMLTAVRALTTQTGIQFVVEPSNEPFRPVTVQVHNVGAEDAIRYICTSAGATFRCDESGVYIISKGKPAQVQAAPAPAPKKAKVVRLIKVLNRSAQEAYDMVMYGIPFDAKKNFAELRQFARMGMEDGRRIYGPNFRTASDILNQGSFQPTAVGSTPRSTPLNNAESGSDIPLPGESAGAQVMGGGGMMGGVGGQRGGTGGGFGSGIGGQNGGVGGQGGSGTLEGGRGLVGESIDFISYDPNDNSLVVRGSEEDITALQNTINMFDVAPQQVLIKVEFIETTDTLSYNLGYEFLYNRGTVYAGTRPGQFVTSSDPVFLNWASGNVTGRLRALLTEGTGKVVTAPLVRTLNNQPASINSSVTTYFFINNIIAQSGGNTINAPQAQEIDATTYLTVAPRINNDGTITMFLTPQIQNFVGTSKGPDGSEIPNRASQQISVVVRVRNGETIMLGGLNSKNENNSVSRVPVLSELPIVGQFFRSNTRNHTNSELLIFVTPTVVDDDAVSTPGGP